MRFSRLPDVGPFEDTRRKRLALARKQRLERESLPLFAEQIAEQQPDADTVMAQRAAQWDGWQQKNRDHRAAQWRRARAKLASYGDNIRPVLLRLWNAAPYPATPEYLLGFLHSFDVGRIDPDNPPWVYRGPPIKQLDAEAIEAIARRARERMAGVRRST